MKLTTLLILLFTLSFSVGAQDDKKEWTLQECIDYALDNNLDVQRSLLNLQGQDVNLEQAKWSRWPNLNANGNFGPNWGRSIDPTTNLFVTQRINSAGVNANSSVTLFNAFRIANTIKQADLAFQASEKDLEVSKNSVILSVITFYTNVLFTYELHQNALSQLESTKEQVELTQKQVDAGALPRTNLLDLQAQEATNELNVVTAENNWILAKIQLKQVLQLPPQNEVDIVVPEINVDEQPDLTISAYEVYQNALASRPEIQSAQLNVESSEYGVNAAKANLYPSLTLNAGLRTNYSDIIDERFIPDPNQPTSIVTDANGAPVFQPVDGLRLVGTQQAIEQVQVVPNGELVDFGFTDQFDENLSYFLSVVKPLKIGMLIPTL
ncbi:MAG: TolC family protein, partial [Bacteroidota bacterium]